MAAEKKTDADGKATKNDSSDRRGVPTWKKMLLSLAALLVVSGLLIQGYGLVAASDSDAARENGGATISLDPQTSLLPRDGGIGGSERSTDKESQGDGALEKWSPALVKGGLSFFLGFALGYVFRTFFKLSALVVGMIFLGVFGLAQIGFIEGFNWDILEQWYGKVVARVSEEAQELKSFVAGSVPSAGMAGLGMFTGFKKK